MRTKIGGKSNWSFDFAQIVEYLKQINNMINCDKICKQEGVIYLSDAIITCSLNLFELVLLPVSQVLKKQKKNKIKI